MSDFNGKAKLPCEPTTAQPGTPEKVAILMERARLGQSLWHPDDAKLEHVALSDLDLDEDFVSEEAEAELIF